MAPFKTPQIASVSGAHSHREHIEHLQFPYFSLNWRQKKKKLLLRNHCFCWSLIFLSRFSLKSNPNLIYLSTVSGYADILWPTYTALNSAAELPSKFSTSAPQYSAHTVHVSTTAFSFSLVSAHSPPTPEHVSPTLRTIQVPQVTWMSVLVLLFLWTYLSHRKSSSRLLIAWVSPGSHKQAAFAHPTAVTFFMWWLFISALLVNFLPTWFFLGIETGRGKKNQTEKKRRQVWQQCRHFDPLHCFQTTLCIISSLAKASTGTTNHKAEQPEDSETITICLLVYERESLH